ncbi:MAG: phosphonate transport system substrate-binding protein [Halomonadaceae bacterium T82-2]|nr:MAG: phosphonate transport system substrate-binding protein [Halomonadaceae bacterium T82-2]
MTLRSLRRLAPLIATIGLGAVLPAHAQDNDTLTFGIISTESMNAQREMFQPLLDDMADAVGMPVEPFFATDYAGVIQAMRFDKVDVAWYGNKAAMEAVDRAGGEIFAQTVADDGAPGYWGLMIVNKDSPYHSIDEILDNADQLTFGNGDPNSTSGFLVPGYYVFAKNGVDAASAFKRTLNSSHETNALSVANHLVDVATFNTESMARLKETHPDKAQQLRVIWTSPLIPSDPLVWRENLPEATKAKLRDFFLNYGDTEREKVILAPLQWSGFQSSSNAQLLPIRQLELFKTRANIANDGSLDPQEKARKLEELDARLEELDQRLKQQAVSESMPQAS